MFPNIKINITDNVHFKEVRPALEYLIKSYNEGNIDTIEVIFSRFVNTLNQEPVIVPLLPLVELKKMIMQH